jgi:hypothetical protein
MAAGDNGGLIGGAPQQAPQIPMHKFQCITPNCGVEVAGRAPMPQIFNLATVSGIVFSHERITRCPNCSTPYICMIGGIGPQGEIQFMWTPLPKQGPSLAMPSGQEIEAINKSKLKM